MQNICGVLPAPLATSTEEKWTGPEAGHSLGSSAEVKNEQSFISISPYVFMAWSLISITDNFTFRLIILMFLINRQLLTTIMSTYS
jgi:hypothetical protein